MQYEKWKLITEFKTINITVSKNRPGVHISAKQVASVGGLVVSNSKWVFYLPMTLNGDATGFNP